MLPGYKNPLDLHGVQGVGGSSPLAPTKRHRAYANNINGLNAKKGSWEKDNPGVFFV